MKRGAGCGSRGAGYIPFLSISSQLANILLPPLLAKMHPYQWHPRCEMPTDMWHASNRVTGSWFLTFMEPPFITLPQYFIPPLRKAEPQQTATAAMLIEHAIKAIVTVKAFNAQPTKPASASPVLACSIIHAIWSLS